MLIIVITFIFITENENGEINRNSANITAQSVTFCNTCNLESSGAHKCYICGLNVHVTCGEALSDEEEGYGSKVRCSLCSRKKHVSDRRIDAAKGLQKQAEAMIALSNSTFPPVSIGANVVVRVPDVDRGRVAPRNVLAVVLGTSDGLYKLGSKNGILDRLYCRNEFSVADSNFIESDRVPENQITLRNASTIASGCQQGFISCSCKGNCVGGRCTCKKNNVDCNSKCHPNSTCRNRKN